MQIYLVRHGESEANMLKVFSNRDLPHELTERGKLQVVKLAERLKGVEFGTFHSSPILRARQSADIQSARLGLAYRATSALLEYDVGQLEGRCDPESWQHYDDVRDAWFREHRWDARIGGGESFDEIRKRFLPLIQQIISSNAPRPVLLLGHGGTFTCMLPLVLSNVDFSFACTRGLGHTEYVLAETCGDTVVCVRWGATIF